MTLWQSAGIINLDSNHVLVGSGEYRWKTFSELISDRPAFYFPDFFLQTERPWLEFERYQSFSRSELACLLGERASETLPEWSHSHKEICRHAFNELKTNFFSSRLEKAVLYAFKETASLMTEARLKSVLQQSLDSIGKYPVHLYGFWNSSEGLMGVTPELLFDYDMNENISTISTVALAGTSLEESCQNGFKNNAKESTEHRITIQGILESLASIGVPKVGETSVLSLPALNHLKTPIRLEIKETLPPEQVIRLLHPTPALGAYPKTAGLEWLEAYQKMIYRGRYGAPVGILHAGHKKFSCYVAIRNVQWNREGMRVGAGCGIIRDSVFEQEWDEIQLKMHSVGRMLNI